MNLINIVTLVASSFAIVVHSSPASPQKRAQPEPGCQRPGDHMCALLVWKNPPVDGEDYAKINDYDVKLVNGDCMNIRTGGYVELKKGGDRLHANKGDGYHATIYNQYRANVYFGAKLKQDKMGWFQRPGGDKVQFYDPQIEFQHTLTAYNQDAHCEHAGGLFPDDNGDTWRGPRLWQCNFGC